MEVSWPARFAFISTSWQVSIVTDVYHQSKEVGYGSGSMTESKADNGSVKAVASEFRDQKHGILFLRTHAFV